MPARSSQAKRQQRRSYPDELRKEAVQMVLDGHSVPSVADRLGLSSPNLLYRWRRGALGQGGVAARTLDQRVHHLQEELRRVERERDILKKALAILSRHG